MCAGLTIAMSRPACTAWYRNTEFNTVYTDMQKIYFVTLAKGTENPFKPKIDEAGPVTTGPTPKEAKGDELRHETVVARILQGLQPPPPTVTAVGMKVYCEPEKPGAASAKKGSAGFSGVRKIELLEKVLINVAEALEKRTARQLELFVRLLEPIMLLVMALATLLVVAGLLLPVFKMSSAVRG